MVRPNGDKADPLLVRLNKDSGAVIDAADIYSSYFSQDEFTAIAVDREGNYILGGLFHDQLFTDPNDGVNTMGVNVMGGKSQSFYKICQVGMQSDVGRRNGCSGRDTTIS
jgi:hypothetical protein